MSEIVSFKVPRELKEKMRRYKDRINWSKLLRDFLAEKIRLLEAEENLKKISRMIGETKGVPRGFSASSIREDRDGY
ncbi:MAG: type II toxin-antitoxin system VapB family antitoxin [Candidatus Njordarchaeales archaeon]